MDTARTFCSVLLAVSVAGIILTGCSDHSGQSHTEAGIRKLHREQYESAEKLFKEAILRNPNNAAAHCNLGIAYWQMGEYRKALEPFRKASEINREDPLPHEYKGLIYAELELWDKARRSFYSALERNLNSTKIVTHLAIVELKSGNLAKGRMFLQRALEIDPAYGPALYNLAMLHSGQAPGIEPGAVEMDASRAAEYFEDYLEVADNPGREQKASRYLKEFRSGSVMEGADTASRPVSSIQRAETEPEPDAKKLAGHAAQQPQRTAGSPDPIQEARKALEDKEYDRALIVLNKAYDENPENADLLWELAVVYDRHLAYKEKAEEIYSKFARLFPGDPRAEKRRNARRAASRSPEQQDKPRRPNEALEEWGRGLQLHQAGDIDKAIGYYRKALALDRKCFNAAYNLGVAYREKEEYKFAETVLKQAVKIKPDKPRAFYMLGLVQFEQDDYRSARENLNKALKLKPEYAQPHFVFGLIYHEQERKDLAITHFRQCADLAGEGRLAKRARDWLEFLGN
ncbi:MAG: tetratricopeptide repeat protein [Verrucomicrobiota bacterium]